MSAHQTLHERDRAAHRRHLAEHCVLHLDALVEVLVDAYLVLEPREEGEEVRGGLVLDCG